jgi:hypothetical protein
MPSGSLTWSLESATETTGALIPIYEMVPYAILKTVEDAASVVQGSFDEGGEYLAKFLVESKLVEAVPDGTIIILPLAPPTYGQVTDFTYLATNGRLRGCGYMALGGDK